MGHLDPDAAGLVDHEMLARAFARQFRREFHHDARPFAHGGEYIAQRVRRRHLQCQMMQSHIGVPVEAVDLVALALPERQPRHAVGHEHGGIIRPAAELRPAQRLFEKGLAGGKVAHAEAEMIDALRDRTRGDRLAHDDPSYRRSGKSI